LKLLAKKYSGDFKIWNEYLEFLFEIEQKREQAENVEFFAEVEGPRVVLSRALQALPKKAHLNIISKYGILEYKGGNSEKGRTMLEGILKSYPKRYFAPIYLFQN
jgi:rRNA biogenesis protein RRP5